MDEFNSLSLDTLCAALCKVMGVEPPKEAAEAAQVIVDYAGKKFNGEKADRLFMYNPDAVAQWVQEKYPEFMDDTFDRTELHVPFATVMPSVTPVCFATMYTGAQPEVHGITVYKKPVLTIDTIFDAFIRAGKKAAIIADTTCSIGKIFLERDMDYFIYETVPEINAKACELILEDKYDLIVVYNENFDAIMHHKGPEDPNTLAQLTENSQVFSIFCELIRNNWKNHNTLLGFAMDHGCHEIDAGCGSHGLYMPEDINILHHYICLPKKAE